MPNWCENDLFVEGTSEELARFRENMACEDQDGHHMVLSEERLIPYPEKFRTANRDDGFNQGGYEWCITNWGTKWGFCGVELVGSKRTTEGIDELSGGYFQLTYTFDTAWSPPEPLIKRMGELYPNLMFDLRYYERGSGFKGRLLVENGEVVEETQESYSGGRGG